MYKTAQFLAVLLGLFLSFSYTAALAHHNKPQSAEKKALRDEKKALEDKFEKEREEFHEEVRRKKAGVKAQGEELKDIKDEREALKHDYLEKKKEIETKLQQIKSKEKQARAEELNNKLVQYNQERTEKFSRKLDRIAVNLADLEKLPDAAEKAAAQIAAAKTAIEEARTATKTQSEKTYGFQFSGDQGVKNAFATVKRTLQDDLRAVRKLVKDSHQAVVAVRKVLRPKK